MMRPAGFPSTDIDLWSDEVLVNPYPSYATLRELGSLVWLNNVEAFALTQYDVARAVLQDWETFSSASGVGVAPEVNAGSGGSILTSDPPVHDRLRRVLNPQLVPRAIANHQAMITERAEALVDTLIRAGQFDAVEELGKPFSLGVIADLVGLPAEERECLIDRSTASFNSFGPANSLLTESIQGLRDLLRYGRDVAVPGRLDPNGWGQQIYDAGARGDIEPAQCAALMSAYTFAGMDTTMNALAAAVHLFAENPFEWELVRNDRTLIPSAFNEVLRMHPPVQRFSRQSTCDIEIGGAVLPAGSRVVVLFGSANRDELHYAHPDRFDVTRNPVDMLSFGRGVHHCVGAGLARSEGHAVLAALAERVARFNLVTSSWRRNNAIHGLEHCIVRVELSS